MDNLRYANADHTLIRAVKDDGIVLDVPTDSTNRHYQTIMAAVEKGDAIVAPYEPDPNAIDSKLAKAESEFVRRMLTTGKSADEIAADLKAEFDLDQLESTRV